MKIDLRYSDYLLTDQWKEISNKCKKLAGNKCSECQSTKTLEAHHITYENVGMERQEDLQCLCRKCHSGKHKSDIKIKKIDLPLSFLMIGNGKLNMTSNVKSIDLIEEMINMSKAEIFAVNVLKNSMQWSQSEITGEYYNEGISHIYPSSWDSDSKHRMFQKGIKELKLKGLAIKLNNKQYMINPLAIIPTNRETAIRQWNISVSDEFKITQS